MLLLCLVFTLVLSASSDETTCKYLCNLKSDADLIHAARTDSLAKQRNLLKAEMQAALEKTGKTPYDCFAARQDELYTSLRTAIDKACGRLRFVFPADRFVVHYDVEKKDRKSVV